MSSGASFSGYAVPSHQEESGSHKVSFNRVHVVARNPCPTHGRPDDCPESIVGDWTAPPLLPGQEDGSTIALLQLTMANIFNQANGVTGNIKDTGGTGRNVGANSASTILMIVAGTSGTAPAFADNALGAIASGGSYGGSNSSGNQAATSGAPSTNTFTVTAIVTNISAGIILYKEIGVAVTVGGNTFLICHDTVNGGLGFSVSINGTLTVTYPGTFT